MVKKKKDFGENNKKTEARERRVSGKRESQERQQRDEENRFWKESGDGALSKAQTKRKEQEKVRNEALAKKQEARLLAKEEEETIGKSSKKNRDKLPPAKVTQYQLQRDKEAEQTANKEFAKELEKEQKKEVDEQSYVKIVDVENINRQDDTIEARNIDEALTVLKGQFTDASMGTQSEDLHPERRRKAAYKDFYENQLVELKEAKPGLKLSQYKDLIFKRWLKSPENPTNQQQQ